MSVHFIDHDEYGVALERIRETIIEESLPISTRAADELVQLAEMMEIETCEVALRELGRACSR